jgi:hypothetical protein
MLSQVLGLSSTANFARYLRWRHLNRNPFQIKAIHNPRGTAAQSNFHTFIRAGNRQQEMRLDIPSILHNLETVSQIRFGTQVA